MSRYIISAVMALFISLGSASAQGISRHIAVDDSFAEGELGWQGLPGGYEYRVKIIEVNGVLELCGVGAFTNMTARNAAVKMLRGAELKINGRTVLRNFFYFNKVNRASQLNRAMASCKSTGTRVPRGKIDIDVDWPDGSFRN